MDASVNTGTVLNAQKVLNDRNDATIDMIHVRLTPSGLPTLAVYEGMRCNDREPAGRFYRCVSQRMELLSDGYASSVIFAYLM